MKLLVLLCVCAIAIAENWSKVERQEIQDQYYQPQREYFYLYNGQLSSGLPAESDSHAVSRYEALFSLIFTDQETCIFRIHQVRFGSRNGGLSNHRKVQPFEAFDEAVINEGALKALKAPLRMKYINGVITEIDFDGDDLSWSENIKRAILNLVQINMKKTQDAESKSLPPVEDTPDEKDDNKHGSDDFYTVLERTMEGICETTYTFNKSPRQTSGLMRVTKSINYNRCTKRVDLRYNHRFSQPKCGHCELNYDKEDGLMPSTVINYEVVGNKDHFLIKNVDIKSDYIFSPLNPKDLVMETFSTATMRLVKVAAVSQLVEPKNTRKDTLLYIAERVIRVERFIMYGDEELDEKHVYSHVKYKYELADEMLRKIVKVTSNTQLGVEPEAPHQFARLVELFRSCTSSDLEIISRELYDGTGKYDSKTQQKMRDIVLDGWSLVATYETMRQIVDKIENGKVSDVKAIKALHNLMLNCIAISEQHVDMIFGLCKHATVQRNPTLKQACLLTVGGMINGVCARINDEQAVDSTLDRCPHDVKEKYQRELSELYRSAKTRYEKLLALRVIGNAGLDTSVHELEAVITDRAQDRIYRVQAIDSLRHMRPVMPRKVRKILFPIFKDRTEHPEVRIAALLQIIHTLPDRSVLDQIAQSLYHETSRQVLTFTSTMLKTFAASENPCEKRLADDLHVSLRLARVEPARWSDSKFMHMPVYSEDHRAGITLDLATIFANDSVIPRYSMFSFDVLQFGQWRKETLQMGFIQYHLEQLLEKLIGAIEQSQKRSTGPVELLRSIFKNLGIKSRRGKSDGYALLYMRRFNMDFAMIPMDAESLPELFMQQPGDVRHFIDTLMRGYKFNVYFGHFGHENYHKLPTSVGIPLHYCSKMPSVGGIEGEIKLSIDPQDFTRLKTLKLSVNARPTFSASHLAEMYSVNPIIVQRPKMIQSFKMNMPINGRFEINFGRKTEVKWIMKVPEEKQQIILAQTRFVTSTSNPRNTKTFIEPLDKSAHLRNQLHHMETPNKIIGKKWLGMLVHIRGQWHENPLQFLRYTPVAFLAGENELEVTIEKDRDSPTDEIVTKFEFEMLKDQKMGPTRLNKFQPTDAYERELFFTDKHQEEYEPEKGQKVRMQMEIKRSGHSSETAAEMEVLAGCDERGRYCMVDVEASRKPVYDNERSEWTMKAKMESLYPENIRSVKELSKKQPKLIAYAEFEWGSDEKQHVNVKLQGGQSPEQIQAMAGMNKEHTPVQRHKDVSHATQLNQYKILANYKVGHCFKHTFNRMLGMLKSKYTYSTQSEYMENPENKLFAKVTIDPQRHDVVDVNIVTPEEFVEIHGLTLPFALSPYKMKARRPLIHAQSFAHLVKKMLSRERAECTVSSRQVNTFDDVEIKMPLTTCYSVVAKDCRSDHPTFAVLMRKLRKNSDDKKMKIINEDRVIELEPTKDEIVVRIDGKEEDDDEHLREIGIERRDDMVTVDLEDILIRFDGKSASVKVSSLFKNGQCGICGDYDGEKLDELRTADNQLTDDVEAYSRSYFHKDDECSIEEDVVKQKNNYNVNSDAAESFEDDEHEEHEFKKPILRTKIIEHNFEVCFSMKPVLECPDDTFAVNDAKTHKKVAFTCISRSNHDASKLVYRSREEILNLDDYKKSFVEEIPIPEKCRAL